MPWATVPAEFRVSDTPPYGGAREALDHVLATKALDEQAVLREKARREMFELLTAEPEPVATKGIDRPPVQIASFGC